MQQSLPDPTLVEQITRQTPPNGAVAIWWLGQSSLVLKASGETVYIDPYLALSAARLVPPAFAPETVNHADLILCTHDHGDHIDPAALPALAAASPQARIVAPRPALARVQGFVDDPARVIAADADQPLVLGPIEVLPIAAKHEEFDHDPVLGYPYLGYVLRFDDLTIYNAGDTIPYAGLIEQLAPLNIDLAFLPINGRDFYRTSRGTIGNMDEREAAKLAAAIGADTVVPVHYGMFAGNTTPPGHFISYLAEHYPTVQAHVMGRYRGFIYTPWRRR
jgi:L-ascorbate metabolism protein UlaG (beta-lactamase superfamily)